MSEGRERLVSALLEAGFRASEIFDDNPTRDVLVSARGLRRLHLLTPDTAMKFEVRRWLDIVDLPRRYRAVRLSEMVYGQRQATTEWGKV